LPQVALAAALFLVSVTVAAEDSFRFRQEATLASFLGPEKSLMLRNARAGADVFFPVSDRIETIQANLHLEFTNSISLVQNRSQLRVSLNGNVLAQFRLNPDRPTVVANIELPERLLERGYNRLTFGASQHYTEQCEDPNAPELWTRIDPVASTIRLEGTLASIEPRLSQLSNLMDRKLWGPFELSLVTGTTLLEDKHLRWGSLISQGAPLRLDYVPLNVRWLPAEQHTKDQTKRRRQGRRFPRMAQEALVGRDAVLFGTRKELAPFLTSEQASRIVGAYLSVAPLDDDPAHFLLVISGTNDAEVELAATAFAFPNVAFPEAPESM